MKKLYVLLLVLTIGLFLFGVLINRADITMFIDPASLIIVVVPTLLLLLSNFSWKDLGRAFTVGFRKEKQDEKVLKISLLFFEAAQKYVLFSGFLGFMLGFIVLLGNYGAGAEAVSAGIALALLTFFYALFIIFVVIFPFKNGIKKRLLEAGSAG